MSQPDVLAQFLETRRATSTTCTSYVVPGGILTMTVEFEPWDDEDEEDEL